MTDRYAMNAMDSADFSRSVKLPEGKREPMVTCPNCGGDGNTGLDEEGRYYTCYRCCETGMVTKASADAEAAEEAEYLAKREAEEAARRKDLGVPDGWGYVLDEYEGVILIAPRSAAPPKPAAVDYDDDIPF